MYFGRSELREQKNAFDAQYVRGLQYFQKDSVWEGTRTVGKNTTSYRWVISDLTGDVFSGRGAIDLLLPGHDVYELNGVIDGIGVKAKSGRMIQGFARSLTFEGVVLGRTMIVLQDGKDAAGTRVKGYAMLRVK